MVKSISDKKKLKNARQNLIIEYIAILEFLINRHPDLASEFYEKTEPTVFTNYHLGTTVKYIAKVIGSLSKDMLLNLAIDEFIKSIQFLIPLSAVSIEKLKNKVIIKVPNCPVKRNIIKYSKICKVTLPRDAICIKWCIPSFRNSIEPFGFDYECKLTENGCLINIIAI